MNPASQTRPTTLADPTVILSPAAFHKECMFMHGLALGILNRVNGITRGALRSALNTAFLGDEQLDGLLSYMRIQGEIFISGDKIFLNN